MPVIGGYWNLKCRDEDAALTIGRSQRYLAIAICLEEMKPIIAAHSRPVGAVDPIVTLVGGLGWLKSKDWSVVLEPYPGTLIPA